MNKEDVKIGMRVKSTHLVSSVLIGEVLGETFEEYSISRFALKTLANTFGGNNNVWFHEQVKYYNQLFGQEAE